MNLEETLKMLVCACQSVQRRVRHLSEENTSLQQRLKHLETNNQQLHTHTHLMQEELTHTVNKLSRYVHRHRSHD